MNLTMIWQRIRALVSGPLAICGSLGILYAAPLAGQAAKVQRDWSKNPAVVQVDTDQDLFVVGDPHADYARLTAVLTGARILSTPPTDPSKAGWNAGKAVVVFTGDLIDKWKNSLMIIALVRSLQSAAADAGGQVIIMTGNHEAEFLAAPNSKKVQEFAGELKSAGLSPTDVAACKGDLGQFLCALPFAARVNDWFFSHAGNTAGRSMSKLISDLQNGVDQDGFKTLQLIGDDSLLEARLGSSPWFQPNGADAQKTLASYTFALGVKHIVQGHQPGNVTFADGVKRKAGEKFQRYGLIFLEDTGMSQGVGNSHGAVLRIPAGAKSEAIAICYDGTATTIWDSGANADIGKIPPCGGKSTLQPPSNLKVTTH
jgi:hypothetical protein